jgi:hypothetical protein
MKPGLILPRIRSNDTIQVDRIDDHVRLMAEQINGGLTRDNLAPSLRLANSFFTESSAVYPMSVAINGAASGAFSIIGVPFVASKILSIGWHIVVVTSPAIFRTITIRIGANNIILINTGPASTTKTTNGSTIISGIYTPDIPNSIVSAGVLLLASCSILGSDLQTGTITLTMTSAWST